MGHDKKSVPAPQPEEVVVFVHPPPPRTPSTQPKEPEQAAVTFSELPPQRVPSAGIEQPAQKDQIPMSDKGDGDEEHSSEMKEESKKEEEKVEEKAASTVPTMVIEKPEEKGDEKEEPTIMIVVDDKGKEEPPSNKEEKKIEAEVKKVEEKPILQEAAAPAAAPAQVLDIRMAIEGEQPPAPDLADQNRHRGHSHTHHRDSRAHKDKGKEPASQEEQFDQAAVEMQMVPAITTSGPGPDGSVVLQLGAPTSMPPGLRRLMALRTSNISVKTSFLPLSISSSGGEQVLYAEGTGVFDTLPDELAVLIYQYLDIPSVVNLSETCTRMYGLAWDPSVWNDIAKHNKWREKQTKEYYIKEYTAAKQRERELKARLAREAEERRRQAIKDRAKNGLAVVASRVWDWLYLLLAVYGLTTFTLKIERHIDWPWFAIIFPIFIYAIHTCTHIGIYAGLKRKYGDVDMEPKGGELFSPLFATLYYDAMDSYHRRHKIGCLSPLVILAPFLILLFFFVVIGKDSIPPWCVPIPLHLVSFYLMALPYFLRISFCSSHAHKQLIWQGCLSLGTLFSVFLGLLSAKLANPGTDALTWVGVVSPLVALEGWLLVLPLLLCACRCLNFDSDEDTLGIGGWLGGFSVAAIPLLTFELMVALILDAERDYTWAVTMTPIYLFASGGIIMCIITNIVITCDC